MGAVPPFTALAVKVTGFPEQLVVAFVAILIDGTTEGVTDITILFELAVFKGYSEKVIKGRCAPPELADISKQGAELFETVVLATEL